MRLLHIIATPRAGQSNTLRVSEAFIENLLAVRDDVTVDAIDLYHYDLPAIAGDNIEAKYMLMFGQPIDRSHEESWRQIETLIADFLAADAYLISAPMWNFTIPYALKYYIDCIVQPGYLFRYNETGQVVPMVNGKKLVCATSYGGDYSPGSPMQAYNFHEPYLRTIFGFVGVNDVEFITAQPMNITTDMRDSATTAAIGRAAALARSAGWAAPSAPADALVSAA